MVIRERDPFTRALQALRQRVRAGAFVQGEALTIIDLARELDLSATPVREALSRLAGEGLIEDRRGRGYFGWRVDALDLVELYDLSALHVGAALSSLIASQPTPPGAMAQAFEELRSASGVDEVAARGAELVFGALVQAGGGRALVACHATLADRLEPARRVDVQVLDGVVEELAAMAAAFNDGAWVRLAEMVETYHARRRAVSAKTVVTMRRARTPGAF